MIEFVESFEPEPNARVIDLVVVHLPRRDVEMTLEVNPFGVAGERWVARSDNGLRHAPDPEDALSRFASRKIAESMGRAIVAFRDLPSEESEIEVK